MHAPPERIELAAVGAVLRRHHPDDLDALHTAIEESRDHLRPFMPWADQTRADTAAFLGETAEQWDRRTGFGYLIIDAADGDVLGGCGIHRRVGPGAVDIGYWLRSTATGRGLVTASAAALTDAALALADVARVEIHCDEANTRSAAVPRRLGFRLDRIEPDHISAPGDLGRSMIWVRGRGDSGSAANRLRRSAHDATESST
jgi:RimJ/RimL family protein N-acetyltransferase